MKTILIILTCLFSFLSLAQNPPILWQKNIGGSGDDGLNRIEIQNSTDYFLIGNSDSDISGDKTENSRGFNDIWIIRLDQNHNILWDKTIGASGYDIYHSSIVKNDTLFIVSFTSSPISGEKTLAPLNTDGTTDIWFLALDLSGNILWQKLYGGTEDDGGSFGNIIALPNNNLLIGINSRSGISGNKTEVNIGFDDFWLVEISSTDGAVVNQNTIGSTGADNIRQLFLSPNNSIIITGKADQGSSGDKTDPGFGSSDIWLVEVDMNLNVLQNKCFGGTDPEIQFDGSATINYIDGFYYLISHSSSAISGNKTAPKIGLRDYWFIKMDTNFNIIWDKTYGGSSFDYGSGIIKLGDNKLLLNGYSKSLPGSGTNGNKTSPRYGVFDAWLLIVDTLGNIIAQETYGGNQDDFIAPITNSVSGIVYLLCGSNSGISGNKTVPTNGGSDAWLMEIDASGFLNTESIKGVNTTVSVYPNPTEGIVNVKFKDLEEDVTMTFYTVDGKVIHQENISTNSVKKEFNFSGTSQMVFYTIEGDRINYSGKIVIK